MIEFRTNSTQSLLVFEQEIGTRSGLAEMPAAATLNTLFVFHFFRHLAPAAARLGIPAAATPNLDVCADSFLHPFIPIFDLSRRCLISAATLVHEQRRQFSQQRRWLSSISNVDYLAFNCVLSFWAAARKLHRLGEEK